VTGFCPVLLYPAGRLAHTNPVRHVRDEFPFRASCFHRDLPHVVGFPYRRVLRSIRLPMRMRWAFPLPVLLHLPVGHSVSMVRFQHRSVSGFPLLCPKSCIPSFDASRSQERLGPPKFFNVSLPACHGLRTPADHTPPCQDGGVCVAFGGVKTLGIRDSHVEAVPALQGTRLPLRPTGYSVYASPILFAVSYLTPPPWTQDSIRVGG
jgi:hypothetical protein